jgi:hypothetical protein
MRANAQNGGQGGERLHRPEVKVVRGGRDRDRPVSVGTMCFPWAIRKLYFLSPPMISARVDVNGSIWQYKGP